MILTLVGTGASALLLAVGWWFHTRVRGFLPDDHPSAGRKRHERPTPMAGMLPAAVAFGVLIWTGQPFTAGAVLLAAAVGIWDDIAKHRGGGGAPWLGKAAVLSAAAVAIAIGAFDPATAPIHCALAVLFGFVVINATNFLDNHNGVATVLGVVALAVAGGADPARAPTALAGVWLAFLPWNWPRARMFLGDSGAYALGACLAAVALDAGHVPPGFDWLPSIALTAVPLADFVQVVCARLWLGYAPWIGDRRHLTHLLRNRGVPDSAVAPLLGALAATIAGFATGWSATG